jgi:hypothetical protein
MNRVLLTLAALVAVTGCKLRPTSEAQATTEPPYVFPHSPHLENDVACSHCHAGIEKATKLDAAQRHVKLPANISKNENCSGCHDTEPKITVPSQRARARLSFNHADHLPRVKGDCKGCHQALPDKGDTSRKTPSMASCTACHNHQTDFVEARCTPCHTDLKGYQPVTAFAHQGDWMRIHGRLARPVAESCAQCHDQTYCGECHTPQTTPARPSVIWPEEVTRAFIHRGDYVSRHMIEASANPASCRKCHGSPFCQSCHELQGVTLTAPAFRAVHPPFWAVRGAPGATAFHGDAARRDITSCAGCHDNGADAICVRCHNVGNGITAGLGANGPHPQSFVSKHRNEDKSKNGMCLACHTGGL